MVRRKYRSQAGIVHDILKVLSEHGPLPATRIATYANLPYDRLRVILASLESNGLIERTDKGYYTITSKGLEALATLHHTLKLLENLGFKL